MNYFEGNEFFLLLFVVLLIGFVVNFFEKRKDYYILVLSLLFAGAIYGKSRAMIIYLLAFVIYQYFLVFLAQSIEVKRMKPLIFLSIFPLVINKVFALTSLHLLAFIGISYMSFKTIQIMLEISDGLIKEKISIKDYLQFLLFFPTVSAGPIDRSRRFLKEINEVMPRKEYLELAGDGVYRIVLGLLYKVVLSTYVYQMILALSNTGTVVYSIKYMYLYTLYLFFDFAGYSLMAVGSSNILGIQTPMNFNKPFLSVDIKDFWTRWHITLSTWLRDFVFSRVLMQVIRKKWFKNRLHNATYAYMVNMLVMGFWHGLSVSYIVYGFYHGVLMAGFEVYQKKSTFYKKNKNKNWYKLLSWFVTMNLVMIGFFIFSGEPYKILLTILKR
ncbi:MULTISPECIES: D-alanyl-lipoteichoic acid biosynthesis protein DltB [Streptococcus]|jgi:D-alanyl-lipoteichoic acid biosynthesis protein dltB|uniref:D-alanyl-lipoteichoic acid biosynthesis protein DltB n=2 Tax=Streptococcus mitis group TaxID=3409772 RepID=A0A387AZN7_9STRE|nr:MULTISPECIES: D-alanyl-lipoteichoic acid biosynthesis protein DltB [Streptococcus]AYF96624.1 D-alanyl-lipoteichoic acid biosynthesis protein DltB [Streptococcus gwangjuense]MBR9645388.1 D-alanyl-lipoteichoic acid biosynthesis protein DltB [Streptococcus sp. 11-4097]OAN12065.1 D-alanyl-lipoteichoic acid biosynthesis protein DltB [Streptococcus sp. CCUG 49591]RSJ05042.1 Peptidoglycan O-acetyltransferase [Streptococcus mitis]